MQASTTSDFVVPKIPSNGREDDCQQEAGRAPLLQIYVASHCASCGEALRLACVVAHLFPGLKVEVIDLDELPTDGTDVFAVPTYVWNGRICFLGNPSEQELCDLLADRVESRP